MPFRIAHPIALALAVTVATMAIAGENQENDIFGVPLEELAELTVIVDVASMSDEQELLAPSTVALITRADWQRRGARTVAEALSSQPGVLVAPTTLGGTAVSIRGFTASSIPVRGINTQLDGVPINEFRFGTALYDLHSVQLGALDRIEMIRGPGSSLYGADAFHGVVSLKTFESNENLTELDATVGPAYRSAAVRVSRGLGRVRMDTALSFDGQSDLDLGYRYTDAGGLPAMGRRAHEYDSYMGVVKFRTETDAGTQGRVGLYVKGHDQRAFPGLGRLSSPTMSAADHNASDSEFVMVNGGVSWTQNKLSTTVSGYAWKQNVQRFVAPAAHFDFAEFHAGTSVLVRPVSISLRTTWTAGVDVDLKKILTSRLGAVIAPDQGTRRLVGGPLIQARTSFLDGRLNVVYGARYDLYSDADAHLSPRLAVIYKVKDDTSLKLLYGNAYRPPTATERAGSVTSAPARGAPETIDTLELVYVRSAASHREYVTVFYSDWHDAIVLMPIPNPAPGGPTAEYLNVGRNTSRGIEAGASWIGQRWRADVSGSVIRSRDEDSGGYYDAFPRVIANVGIGYKIAPYRIDVYLNNRVHRSADEGPATRVVANPMSLKDYFRTDLTVGWKHPRHQLEVTAAILNLFGRDTFFPSPVTAEGGIPDIGRTWSVGVRGIF